jgi:hypothetical protein
MTSLLKHASKPIACVITLLLWLSPVMAKKSTGPTNGSNRACGLILLPRPRSHRKVNINFHVKALTVPGAEQYSLLTNFCFSSVTPLYTLLTSSDLHLWKVSKYEPAFPPVVEAPEAAG